MHPIQEPITGNEYRGDPTSPLQALSEFYRAFNARDLRLMADNWGQSDEAAMDNPLGGIKRGWTEIRGVYERIFAGPAEVYVEFFDYTLHETAEMFYTVGTERGHLRAAGNEISLAIRTTRLFRRMDGRWRQMHHHGSIDDPRLLDRYQAAVLG